MQKNITTVKKKSVLKKIGKGIGIFILSILVLIVLILVLIQTGPVQNFGRKKIVSFLENKLKTEVDIKRLSIDFPKMLVLEGVYIEDLTKDTLIAGNQLKVDIDMFKLVSGEIQINEINLNGITAKIKRQLPDKVFNYQFIVDAFATPEKTPKVKDTAALKMAINKIIVDKTRLVYYDVVTGNDVDVYLGHFDTRIDVFDLTNLKYDVPSIVLRGVRGRVNQVKPMEVTAVANNPDPEVKNEAPQYLAFTNGETRLEDIDFSYSNTVSAMATRIAFKDLVVHPEYFDLKNSAVSIKDITLNNLDGFVRMGKGAEAQVVKLTTETGKEVATEALPWKFQVGSIRLNDNNFAFDDNTKARMGGLDFAHLGLSNLTLHADNFLMHRDTISTNITRGEMKDRSGFVLNTFQTDVLYTDKGAELKDLLIKTPGSEIKRSLSVRYPSIAAIQKEMGLLEMDIDIDNSYIQVRDILYFVPALASQPAFRNPSSRIFVNSEVSGSVNRLVIDELQIRGLQNTNVDVSGVIGNAMDPNNVNADLSIRKFSTSRGDILSLTPPGTIPKNITIPENLSLTGVVRGGMRDVFADLSLNTSLGSARVNGRIANATDKINARYNATIATTALNVGAITQQPQNVGAITANFKVDGRGYDPDRVNAKINGVVSSANVMKYTYRNLRLDASMANQKFSANAFIKDPNIHLALNAKGNLGGKLPGFVVDADIDSIKTLPLHLTPDPIIYRGHITANFPELNLDALEGEVNVVNSVLVMNNQRMTMDSITLVADYENRQQFITLQTDFAYAKIGGEYKLQQLGDIITETIQPYYAINTSGKQKTVDPYNFNVRAIVYDHPTLHGFVPELKRFDSLSMNAAFSSADGLQAKIVSPSIVYGTNTIENLVVNANTENNVLRFTTNVDQVKSGTSVALYKTSITGSLANNNIDFGILLKDQFDKSKYRLAGVLRQEPNSVFAFTLKPDTLLLNYDPWTINPGNLIRFGSTVVNASNFDLSKGNQHLVINSETAAPNSPLTVNFKEFQIGTLTAFAQSDSLPITGVLNGNVLVRDILKQPNFVTDLNLNNLAFKKDTIGDVNIKVNNNRQNIFETNVAITGRGNDILLAGNYFLRPADKSTFDFNLDIRQLPFTTVQGLSMGAITQAKGNLTGKVAISGSPKDPKIDGGINFNQVGFNPTMLGGYFTIDDETITVNNRGIRFNTFTIKDSASNNLVIDGLAGTTNFTNYDLNLTVKARNFRAINTAKAQNSMYYGQLFFNTNMSIKGTEAAPVIDGSLKVNENTNLSIVLPQAEPGIVDRKGVIEFVDMDAPGQDSLFKAALARYDSSLNKSAITGFDIHTNIEIVKEATFNIVIDEGNGDFLKLKGQAALAGGIDPSGKVTLAGTYEIESGGYELSFNFIRRSFSIQRGSRITWSGEPTDANIDITAVYVANTSAIDLISNQVGEATIRARAQQKLPFQVKLNVAGEMMQPTMTFDIDLPKENTARVDNQILTLVNTKLTQIKQEPSELNKQVFALLLLNRFVSENPFESSGEGGGFNAGSYARQSVSKILTEQLNKLAGDLIAGVDISFDVNTAEDYTTGTRRDRTDFNMNLSKRLLSDRLKVSVGTNYELEGPSQGNGQSGGTSNIIGNVTVDYNLTQNGTIMLRGYRKNDYEAVVEGMVVETGLKFIMSVDYNKFKEIFQGRKARREMRKKQKELDKQQENKLKPEQATTGNTPGESSNPPIVSTDMIADTRKNIAASVKDSTDEKN
jgi:hypothetical protein